MTEEKARDVFREATQRLDGFPATDLPALWEAWKTLFGDRPGPAYRDEETGRQCLDLAEMVRQGAGYPGN
jgi:hypothetical protein